MINDKAILVGVDGSHASYKATWWAANYAKHAGLTLQIVCAYSLPSYAAVSFDATYTAMGDDNAAHNDAQEILSKAKAIADEQGVEATTLIVTGDPASVFVELSRNYNLIVIGNRGNQCPRQPCHLNANERCGVYGNGAGRHLGNGHNIREARHCQPRVNIHDLVLNQRHCCIPASNAEQANLEKAPE